MHNSSAIGTPICTRRTTIHQFIWQQVKCGTLGGSPKDAEWLQNTIRLRTFIPDIGIRPPGMTLQRTAWVRLNRLRNGVGRFRCCLHKWAWPLLRLVWRRGTDRWRCPSLSKPAVLNWGARSSRGCEKGLMSAMIIQKTIHRMVQGVQKWFFFKEGVQASTWIEKR